MKRSLPGLCLLVLLSSDAGRGGGRADSAVNPGSPAPSSSQTSSVETGSAPPADATAPVGGAPAAAPAVLPVPDLGYNAREGRALYHHYCLTCHGDTGQGDGFNAYNLDPKPRDLSEPAFQSKRSDEDLAAVIRSGGGVAGLSTGMPPWGRTLSERKVRNIVDYLRTLTPPAK